MTSRRSRGRAGRNGTVLAIRVVGATIALLALFVAWSSLASAQTDPPATGDWTILSDTTAVSSSTVVLTGNLVVGAGGSLSLTDVVLSMNSSYPGEFGIYVQPGGSLTILRGGVTATNTTNTYKFVIEGDATIDSSTIERMFGDRVVERFGIQIFSSNVLIQDSIIQYGERGNVYIGAGSPTLRNNTIRWSLYSISGLRSNTCQVQVDFNAIGLLIVNGSSPIVDGNLILENGNSLSFSDPLLSLFYTYWSNVTCPSNYWVYEYFVGQGMTVDGASVSGSNNTIANNSKIPTPWSYGTTRNSTWLYEYRYGYGSLGVRIHGAGLHIRQAGGNLSGTVVAGNAFVGILADTASLQFTGGIVRDHAASYSYWGEPYGAVYVRGGIKMDSLAFARNYYTFFVLGGTLVLERLALNASGSGAYAIFAQSGGDIRVNNTSFAGWFAAVYLRSYSTATAALYNCSVYQGQIGGSYAYGTVRVIYQLNGSAQWVNGAPVASGHVLVTNSPGYVVYNGVLDEEGMMGVLWLAALTVHFNNGASYYPLVYNNTTIFMTVDTLGLISPSLEITFRGPMNVTLIMDDPLAPVVTVSAPLPGGFVGSTTVVLSGTATDVGSGMKAVRVSGDGGLTWSWSYGPFPLWSATLHLEEGTYDLLVSGVDKSDGYSTQRIDSVTVDDTAPSILLFEPELPGSGPQVVYTNASGLFLRGTADEEVSLTLNGAFVAVSGGLFATTTLLVDGPNFLRLEATDRAGNVLEIDFEAVYDTTRPALLVAFPETNYVTNRPALVINGFTEVGVTLTVGDNAAAALDGTFSFRYNLAAGLNHIWVNATDPAGNRNNVLLRVTLDTTPPLIAMTAPVEGLHTRIATVVVSGTVEPSVAFVFINGIVVATLGGAFSAQVPLVEGDNAIIIRATDLAGNEGNMTRTLVLDTLPPDLLVTEPRQGTLFNSTTIRVAGSAPGATGVTINGVDAALEGEKFSADVQATEGEFQLVIVATDAAGNAAVRQVLVNRDTKPPELIVSLLDAKVVVNDAFLRLTGRASGAAYVHINNLTVGVGEDGNFSALVPLSVGINELTIRAEDAAGNSVTILRTVLRPTPPEAASPGLFGLGIASYLLLPAFLAAGVAVTFYYLRRKPGAGA